MTEHDTLREQLFAYAHTQYETQEEYLWHDVPGYAVLRHPCGKWYGVVMNVPRKRLGLSGSGEADILVAKCEAGLLPILLQQPGFLPAYHMNKQRWVSALLDGEAPFDLVCGLLDMSYELTTPRARTRKK